MRPDDPELKTLLTRFVPVRITDFKNVDMNLFRFDYDLTFAILLMSPEGATYSRYGSQDWRTSSSRMSIAGLKKAMQDVLTLHGAGYAPAAPSTRKTLADIPAYADSKAAKEACAHCHYANNFRFAQMKAEDKFSKSLLFQYPLPENLGITLDVDKNNVVQAVGDRSPAADAGVRPGDVVAQADGARVITPADLQFVLNTVPDPGTVTLRLLRDGKSLPAVKLTLPAGWRKTDISWRPSQGGIAPQIGLWAEPLTSEQKRQRGIEADRLGLRVSFFFPGPVWAKTRGDIQMNDVIIGLNGKTLPSMTTRQFHSYFRLNNEVGDTAVVTVLRGSEKRNISVPCMEVSEE